MTKQVTSGQLSLFDMNDVQQGPSFPTSPAPTDGMLWCLTSGSAPYLVYRYNATTAHWDNTTYTSLSGMDPTASGQLSTAYNGVNDLGDDSKVTRYERSIVRGQLADITGLWLNPTDIIPSLATVDASSVGSLHALRKSATDIGVNTAAGSNYANVGTNYTSLVSYLTGLSPKPWDTTSTGTITVTPATWNSTWKSFYDSFNLLQIDVQDRQKAYTDTAAGAIYNTVAHATVAIANPVTFTVPIATIGLPEFQGYHTDSWQVNRNFILNTTGALYNKTSAVFAVTDFPSLTLDAAAVASLNQKQITISLSYNLTGITYGTTNPWIGMELTVNYSDGTHDYVDAGGGTKLGTANTNGWVTTASTYQVSAAKTVSSLSLIWGSRDVKGTIMLQQPKIEIGSKTAAQIQWTPAPQEAWGQNGNRIQPITNPTFSTGTDLTMNVSLYGDGTTNDSISWDSTGNLIKIKNWMDVNLDGNGNRTWALGTDYTGYKMVKCPGFVDYDMTNGTAQVVKTDGSYLTSNSGYTAGDQFSLSNTDNTLYVTIKDTDSGWGETYSPTNDEIYAYFLGWKMCNGTYGSNYTGTGTKTWFPIGDTNLSNAANTSAGTPTDPSAAITGNAINYYQVVYKLGTPIQETGFTFDGLLALIQGSNTVSISYPTPYTPTITTGTIKYATSLATYTQDIAYLIPQTMTRVAHAEQKILDDSIVAIVTSSTEYTTTMAGKAGTADLKGLASSSDLKGVSDKTDGLDTAVNGDPSLPSTDPNYGGLVAKFSKYYTKTEVDTTATGIKESFYQGGGMNLVLNSIGFAGLDFWTNYTTYLVETRDDDILDQLGFGSGFYFDNDTFSKGITQDVDVVIGQHYTLSWYLNKKTGKSGDSTFRFYVQIQEYINSAWTTVWSLADNSADTTDGYEATYTNYTPTTTQVRIRFIGYGSVSAYLTGIMFTIGDVPIKWTLATGEAYNTYINMNINGIRVSQIDPSKREIGYTMMSSAEFAGYYDTNGDGSFEKVFYLNGDETVSKKVRALNEFTMGSIKITKVPNYPDWEPATPYNVGDMVSNGANIYTCTVKGVSGSSGPTVTSGTVTDNTVTWSFTQTSSNTGWAFVKV